MDEFLTFPQPQQGTSQPLSSSTIVSPDLPEEWGGRPKGESRRAIRMREEWDKQRATQIEEAKALQAMDIQQKQFEMSMRDQQMQEDDFYYNRGIKEAEQKLLAQQRSEAKNFISAINSLDPQSPEYRDQLIELRKQYPLGVLDPTANSIIGDYEKVHSVYMDAQKETRNDQKQEQDWRVQQEAMATELGISVDEFTNSETGEVNRIGLMQRVGEERRKKTEAAEKSAEDKSLDKERREAAKPLIREIRDINDELEAATLTAQNSKGKVQQEAANSIKLLQSKLGRREAELLQIIGTQEGDRPEISEEAVAAARKAIQENPDSPQAKRARQIIEAYEASRRSTDEQGGGETISEPATLPQTVEQNATIQSSQKPFNPRDRAELEKLEAELQAERERVGLSAQPAGIRQINEAMASQYASVREKAQQLKEAQQRLDPFAGSNPREAQDIQRALDVVYPPMAGDSEYTLLGERFETPKIGKFDVGDPNDPRVVSAAEFLSNVSPSLLRMVASSPASNRTGLTFEEVYAIAKKAKPSARGRPNKK